MQTPIRQSRPNFRIPYFRPSKCRPCTLLPGGHAPFLPPLKLCVLVHLAVNKRTPTYLQDPLTTTAPIPGRASNHSAINNDLVHQSTRLKLGKRAFSVAAPCNWNHYNPLNSKLPRLLLFLNAISKRSYFSLHTPTHNEHCTGLPVLGRQQHRHCIVFIIPPQ